jgi:hypothetical protein
MRLIASPAAELMFDVFAPVLGGGSPLQPLPRRQLGQKYAKYCRVIIQKLQGQTLSVKASLRKHYIAFLAIRP